MITSDNRHHRQWAPADTDGRSVSRSAILQVEHSSRGDTHNRHQRAWTLLYSAGSLGALCTRPWTLLDILAMLCKQGVMAVRHGKAGAQSCYVILSVTGAGERKRTTQAAVSGWDVARALASGRYPLSAGHTLTDSQRASERSGLGPLGITPAHRAKHGELY
jgi:hypothetical protein